MGGQAEIKIHGWIENLQSQGKFAFSLAFVQEQLPRFSNIAIKSSLNRLTKKRNHHFHSQRLLSHYSASIQVKGSSATGFVFGCLHEGA
jgi:hypothetical protein